MKQISSDKIRVDQLLNKFRSFTVPEDTLSCSQKPAIGAYSEPEESNPHPSIFSL
jgi:hypothetical protein